MGLYQYLHYFCTLNSQDMSTLPQHKSSLLAASGVCLRRINAAGNEYSPITYAHQDDYSIFGLVEGGTVLAEHLAANRQPFHYASLLNISAVYLNEVVLRAKRRLVHTDLSIKEIADSLGINDHAYFSRMFTQATGVSPTLFRQRNRG